MIPDTLYKYMTYHTASKVLNSGKLRWQSPCQFNDKLELERMPVLEPTIDDGVTELTERFINEVYDNTICIEDCYTPWAKGVINFISTWKNSRISKVNAKKIINMCMPKIPNVMEDRFRKHTQNINDGSLRICCLTECENNETMWAHYSDEYKGCVLGFKHIIEKDTPFIEAEKVIYSNSAPVVGSGKDIMLYGEDELTRKKTRIAIYYTKKESWKYEKEWRVMTKRDNEQPYTDFKFYQEELESITIGPLMKESEKDLIATLVKTKYPDCKMYELELNNGTYTKIISSR